MEKDFRKEFLAQIIVIGENYFLTQKLDYEHIYFHFNVCIERRHLAATTQKGQGKLGSTSENQLGGLELRKSIDLAKRVHLNLAFPWRSQK